MAADSRNAHRVAAARITANGVQREKPLRARPLSRMDELTLRLCDGTAIVVPRSLESITTYVLLEQERWFEKETAIAALLDAGTNAIDIGANFGVYSLPLARRAGPGGAVFAYEPASATRAFLEKSRVLNGASNLTIAAAALSDTPRRGQLGFGSSGELHRLNDAGPGESVAIASLDSENRARAWPQIDFVKIDAEGEELRILEGGQDFFARHAPLTMFECKAGDRIDHAVPQKFREMGYGIFRLLSGHPLLVPVAPNEAIDGFEINLFAAKPGRAARLARENRLVERLPQPWTPDAQARAAVLDLLNAQIFAPPFRAFFTPERLDPVHRDALAGYAIWRDHARPATERYAALTFAFLVMRDLCRERPNLARLSSFARFAWECGRTGIALDALNAIFAAIQRKEGGMSEAFWPVSPRFDAVPPGANPADWFMVAVLEHQERCASHSSLFTPFARNLDWLAAQPLASAEIERRRMLQRLRMGEQLPVPQRLRTAAPDHINAEVWRDGLVPNTLTSHI